MLAEVRIRRSVELVTAVQIPRQRQQRGELATGAGGGPVRGGSGGDGVPHRGGGEECQRSKKEKNKLLCIELLTMLEIMKHKDFGNNWLKWMGSIFAYGTSFVLLNGYLAKLSTAKWE